jgi:hypothetical protein
MEDQSAFEVDEDEEDEDDENDENIQALIVSLTEVFKSTVAMSLSVCSLAEVSLFRMTILGIGANWSFKNTSRTRALISQKRSIGTTRMVNLRLLPSTIAITR